MFFLLTLLQKWLGVFFLFTKFMLMTTFFESLDSFQILKKKIPRGWSPYFNLGNGDIFTIVNLYIQKGNNVSPSNSSFMCLSVKLGLFCLRQPLNVSREICFVLIVTCSLHDLCKHSMRTLFQNGLLWLFLPVSGWW